MNLRRVDKPRTGASLPGEAASGKVERHDGVSNSLMVMWKMLVLVNLLVKSDFGDDEEGKRKGRRKLRERERLYTVVRRNHSNGC